MSEITLAEILSTRHVVTTAVVVAAFLTVDPILGWAESEFGWTKVQTNKFYKAAVSGVVVLGAQVLADKLLGY